MDKKLTLSLDEEIIARAKKYAKAHNTSLSKMIESYFDSLTGQEEEFQVTPLVASLTGIIDLPKDYDYQKERSKHLSDKYK